MPTPPPEGKASLGRSSGRALLRRCPPPGGPQWSPVGLGGPRWARAGRGAEPAPLLLLHWVLGWGPPHGLTPPSTSHVPSGLPPRAPPKLPEAHRICRPRPASRAALPPSAGSLLASRAAGPAKPEQAAEGGLLGGKAGARWRVFRDAHLVIEMSIPGGEGGRRPRGSASPFHTGRAPPAPEPAAARGKLPPRICCFAVSFSWHFLHIL